MRKRKGRISRWGVYCGVLGVTVLLAASVQATTIQIGLNVEFSGATPPAGTAPWLLATFESVDANNVTLSLDPANLVGTEKVTSFYFNIADALFGSSPTYTPLFTVTQNAGGPQATGINVGRNSYKADGDGHHDIKIEFATSGAERFQAGSPVISFNIFSAGGITPFDFLYFDNGGGKGDFYAAAHVQSIGSTGANSGWIGGGSYTIPPPPPPPLDPIPEPSTLVLLGMGTSFLVARLRRQPL